MIEDILSVKKSSVTRSHGDGTPDKNSKRASDIRTTHNTLLASEKDAFRFNKNCSEASVSNSTDNVVERSSKTPLHRKLSALETRDAALDLSTDAATSSPSKSAPIENEMVRKVGLPVVTSRTANWSEWPGFVNQLHRLARHQTPDDKTNDANDIFKGAFVAYSAMHRPRAELGVSSAVMEARLRGAVMPPTWPIGGEGCLCGLPACPRGNVDPRDHGRSHLVC